MFTPINDFYDNIYKDEELYERYELTNKQIDFIESQIKTWK